MERDIDQRGLVEHTGTKRNDIGFRAIEPSCDHHVSGLEKDAMIPSIDAPDVDVCSDSRRRRAKYQTADVNPVVIFVRVSCPNSASIGIK